MNGSLQRNSVRRGLISIATLVALWEFTGYANLYDTRFFPIPTDIFLALLNMGSEGLLWADTSTTILRVLAGFIIGGTLGFLAGIATGVSQRIQPYLEPIIQIARPIPAVSLVPLAIVWFGVGEVQKFFIISWASFFPLWVNTHTGMKRVPRELHWTAQVLGADRWRKIREVLIPWALPYVHAGARIALGLAFMATVVAEMSGASAGLGFRIMASHLAFRMDRMLGAIILLGLLGATFDFIFQRATNKYLPWLNSLSHG